MKEEIGQKTNQIRSEKMMMNMNTKNRIDKLLNRLQKENLDAIFLQKDANIRYLSGFTNSDSYLILTSKDKAIITDSRYTEQAQKECPHYEVVRWRNPFPSLPETVSNLCKEWGIKKLGFEANIISFDLYTRFKEELTEVTLIPTIGIVEEIRKIKDSDEISLIRKACEVSDKSFEELLNYITPGVSEKDLEREFQYILKKNGAEDKAFDIIGISGVKTSLPHGIPSDKLIEMGDFVTFDFGAQVEGYKSDMTRTICVGKANDDQKKIYSIVQESQKRGLEAVSAGVLGKLVDKASRDVIEEAGYGQYFSTGLGHGVGLEIHEIPFMSTTCEEYLAADNVLTVEPGIYLPSWGGVRIEDTVLVKEKGCEIFTHTTKNLIEL